MARTLLTVLVVLLAVVKCTTTFTFNLNARGEYELSLDGQSWLRSASTYISANKNVFSTSRGTLKLKDIQNDTGEDILGQWNVSSMHYYSVPDNKKVTFMVRWYLDLPLILFGQRFPEPLSGCSNGDKDSVSSGFPSILVDGATEAGRDTELGYMAYGGIMAGDMDRHTGIWSSETLRVSSGLDSGPLVLFDQTGHAVIIAPFSNFMATSVQYTLSNMTRLGGVMASWGVMGGLMSEWGDIMRLYYNKDRSYTVADPTNNYLAYWTDNGGYYYYATEPEMNYEDTILALKKYTDEEKIPIRNIEYDSWWYPKGPQFGVTQWTSMLSVFPKGLKHMWEVTKWPVVGHNRWWSNYTLYAKQNGGKYDFIVENKTKKALPIEKQFWVDLFTEAKQWGLMSYEQDWLNIQFDEMVATVSSVSVGHKWLRQMGDAAKESGIFIQYCMAPVRHLLTSLEIPAVTQARVTTDYQPGNSNWRVGVTSMLVHAVGLAPYKDNFWTTSVQPGNVYNTTEPFPELHSIAATLTTGPVALCDKIGYINRSLVIKSCNNDGLILKPSRPVMAIDKQFIMAAYSGFTGEIWSTYSSIGGLKFGIILAAAFQPMDKMSVTPAEAGFEDNGLTLVTFPRGMPHKLFQYSDNQPIILAHCTHLEFCVWYITPVLTIGSHKVVILGELDKWVPMSPQRITSITMTSDDVFLTLSGAVHEHVTLTFQVDDGVVDLSCVLSDMGNAKISVMKKKCDYL